MAFSTANQVGIDLNNPVQSNPSSYYASTATSVPTFGPLGMEVFGSDGKIYVFAQANASIPASTSACTVNATTFLVTASGGAYTSPAVALSTGDYAWFGKASV